MRAAAALIVALGAPAVRSELVPLEAAHVATLLDGHNAARCAVGVADLAWSDADAASAAVWAAGCVYEHSTPAERGGRGENMAAAAGVGFPAVLDTANRGWIDEERPNWPLHTGRVGRVNDCGLRPRALHGEQPVLSSGGVAVHSVPVLRGGKHDGRETISHRAVRGGVDV
jgi:hypothetical protein